MKICLISNLYGRYAKGGAEVVVKNTALGLQARGHSVFVISAGPKDSAKMQAHFDIEDNIKVYRFYPRNFYFYADLGEHGALSRTLWTVRDVFNRHSAKELKKLLAVEKPDLVMMHNLKGLGYLVPKTVAELSLKHVLIVHDVQLVNSSGLLIKGQEHDWLNDSPPAKAYQAICRRLFSHAKIVVSPSRFLMDYYANRGYFIQAKKVVLPNPSIFEGSGGGTSQKPKQPTPVITFVGQVENHKGINWLLHFLKSEDFHINGLPVTLKVAGQGSEQQNLRGQYPQAEWLGRVDRQQLKEIFKMSDFLIFPSLCYENSPTVIYEALSLGLPVIASNLGGVPELVAEGQNGFLFEAASRGSLKKALERALSLDNAEYIELSKRAVASINQFTLDNYLKELLAL